MVKNQGQAGVSASKNSNPTRSLGNRGGDSVGIRVGHGLGWRPGERATPDWVDSVKEFAPVANDPACAHKRPDIGAKYMYIKLTDYKGRRLRIGDINTEIASLRDIVFR